jgi:hypothetical protein
MILSFAYPGFYRSRCNLLHIVGFALARLGIAAILLSYIVSRWVDVLVPIEMRAEGGAPTGRSDGGCKQNERRSSEGGQGDKADDSDIDRLVKGRTSQ